MNQPSVFISCVSPEFGQTRSKVANILTGLAYTPVFQEIFGTESGDLRQVLRDKIDTCAGLIQIVGHGYGAEPPTVDAGYGRLSYTQFEFLLRIGFGVAPAVQTNVFVGISSGGLRLMEPRLASATRVFSLKVTPRSRIRCIA